MSISGVKTSKVNVLQVNHEIKLKNGSGNTVFSADNDTGLTSSLKADLGTQPIKINEIQPSSGSTLYLNATNLKSKFGVGLLESDADGNITATAGTGDLILSQGYTLVGNASNKATSSSAILVSPQGNIGIGQAADTSSVNPVRLGIAGGSLDVTGAMGVTGQATFHGVVTMSAPVISTKITNNSHDFTFPSSGGTLATTSDIPSTMAVTSITGITSGNTVIGSAANGTSSNLVKFDTTNSAVGIGDGLTSQYYSLSVGSTGASAHGMETKQGIVVSGDGINRANKEGAYMEYTSTGAKKTVLSNIHNDNTGGFVFEESTTGVNEGASVYTPISTAHNDVTVGGALTTTGSSRVNGDLFRHMIYNGGFHTGFLASGATPADMRTLGMTNGGTFISWNSAIGGSACTDFINNHTAASSSGFFFSQVGGAELTSTKIMGILGSDLLDYNAGLMPCTDNSLKVGCTAHRWNEIFCTNGTINTSDSRSKTSIQNTTLGLDFINALRPVSYKWLEGEKVNIIDSNGNSTLTVKPGLRKHQGMIAQEVKAVMDEQKIDTNDFAGYIYDEDADSYGLRYTEFIAPMVKAVQEVDAKKIDHKCITITTPNTSSIIQLEHGVDYDSIKGFDVSLETDMGYIKPYHFNELYRYDAGVNGSYVWIKPLGDGTENCICKFIIWL